ncbi:MAG TPA: KH domain-containing protein [Deltaproteobacteria bacterium]|nr:KH domain-containing protein [Deltaproteobacteria bacterium]
MNIPDGVQTVEAEGRDLKKAIAGAAQELGLRPEQIDYKLDLSHFRSVTGVSVSRNTVKIVAWRSDQDAPAEGGAEAEAEVEAEAKVEAKVERAAKRPKRKRKRKTDDDGEQEPRKARKAGKPDTDEAASEEVEVAAEESQPRKTRKPRRTRSKAGEEPEVNGETSKPEQLRGAEDDHTEASRFAQEWFERLLELMGVEGKVSGSGNDERVHLAIDAERAGRIVGKRGATLGAIRHLLGLALEKRFGDLTVDVDVGDDRREERRPRRERSRGRDRGRPRGRERSRGRFPEEKLQALARRGAEKALETGRTYTINLELNAYDRRVIHMEISEIDGVDSRSEERGDGDRNLKYIQIIPE